MQFTDPRLGNRRQKKLLQKLAQKAMQKKGYTNRLSMFAKTGAQIGGVRAMTPARGVGARVGARSGGIASLLTRGFQRAEAQGFAPDAPVNTAPVQAARPTDNLDGVTPDAPTVPATPSAPSMGALGQAVTSRPIVDLSHSGYDNPAPGLSGADTQLLKLLQEQGQTLDAHGNIVPMTSQQAYQQGMSYANSPEALNAVQGFDVSPFQSSPSAPIIVGGLVPLGGGMYFDPATGNIHGGSTSAGTPQGRGTVQG